MVSFEEAVKIIKDNFKEDYVIEGFVFENEYVFRLLSKKYKEYHTNSSTLVAVNFDGEPHIFNPSKAFDNLLEYDKAQKNARKVDTNL